MKNSYFDKDNQSKPRIIKIGRRCLFLDSKTLRKTINAKIKEINDNSILPAAVLTEFDDEKSGLLFPESTFIKNYMSFDYYAENYFVSFSGYPTDQDLCRLTKIEILSHKYNIYGIYVGMRDYVADNIFKSYGFSKSTDNNKDCYCFPGICISFSAPDGAINQINIEIETYYVGNYIY